VEIFSGGNCRGFVGPAEKGGSEGPARRGAGLLLGDDSGPGAYLAFGTGLLGWGPCPRSLGALGFVAENGGYCFWAGFPPTHVVRVCGRGRASGSFLGPLPPPRTKGAGFMLANGSFATGAQR